MDIRLTNKYTCKVILLLATYLLSISLLAVIDVISHREYLDKNYYFNGWGFPADVSDYFEKVSYLYTNYRNYDQLSVEEKITSEEIANKQREQEYDIENRITSDYSFSILQAENIGNKELAQRLTQERDEKISIEKKVRLKPVDEFKTELLQSKENEYTALKNRIASRGDLQYYIKDKNNAVFTNVESAAPITEYIKKNTLFSIEFPQQYQSSLLLKWKINKFFWETGTSGYLLVPKEGITKNSTLPVYANYTRSDSLRTQLLTELLFSILFAAAALALLIYLRKEKQTALAFLSRMAEHSEKLPPDVRLFLLVAATLAIIPAIAEWLDSSFMTGYFQPIHLLPLSLTALYISYLSTLGLWVYRIYKGKIRPGAQWKQCLLYRLGKLLQDSLAFKGLVFQAGIGLLLTLFCGMVVGWTLATAAAENDSPLLPPLFAVLLCFCCVGIYLLFKLRQYHHIVVGTGKIVAGDFSAPLESKGRSTLSRLAGNINNIKDGIQKALEERIRNERLKTELITNVSHDLKTPLTSIISSVDLLQREGLSREEQQHYVSILSKKTQRLKVLIEDLFEASKLSSGAVELNLERIDMAALLYQALGEFDERIKSSALTFKVNAVKHKTYALVDGKKTWRVFENLIGNILKYSQPQTRVFIDLTETQNKVRLTLKNLSAYALDFEPSEVFERFKRGDPSRNTEGSGLGLAIAKSIMELQGGTLSLDIDGDLFKVTVEFPSAEASRALPHS